MSVYAHAGEDVRMMTRVTVLLMRATDYDTVMA